MMNFFTLPAGITMEKRVSVTRSDMLAECKLSRAGMFMNDAELEQTINDAIDRDVADRPMVFFYP